MGARQQLQRAAAHEPAGRGLAGFAGAAVADGAAGSGLVAWRAGHFAGAGVLGILVAFIVLLQRVEAL